MNETAKTFLSWRGLLLRAGVILLACLAAFGISRVVRKQTQNKTTEQRAMTFAPEVAKEHPSLLAFEASFPEREVILACEDDVTNDTLKDLLVIYREYIRGEERIVRFVTAIAQADGGFHYTDPLPAPIENQGIQFKNIDKESELEFIISGEKNGAAGYAIYRVIDGQPKDLFGDGMNDCC